MNKQLSEAIARLSELPDDRQQAAAALLLEFLDNGDIEIELTPEQLAELDRRLDSDDFASDEEVEAFFARLKA
ncbi:MAG: hypothetical protein P8Y53_12100 [Pseudolabrys sp.]